MAKLVGKLNKPKSSFNKNVETLFYSAVGKDQLYLSNTFFHNETLDTASGAK
jgi:hypothetical protein